MAFHQVSKYSHKPPTLSYNALTYFRCLRLPVILIGWLLASCQETTSDLPIFGLTQGFIGEVSLNLSGGIAADVPRDRVIELRFNQALDASTLASGVKFFREDGLELSFNPTLFGEDKVLALRPASVLEFGTAYRLELTDALRSSTGAAFAGQVLRFETILDELRLTSLEVDGGIPIGSIRIIDCSVDFSAVLEFSEPLNRTRFEQGVFLLDPGQIPLEIRFFQEDRSVALRVSSPLPNLSRAVLSLSSSIESASGAKFAGMERIIFTGKNGVLKFPLLEDEALLDLVQEQTFTYFWEGAHPLSGMIRERASSGELVTSGGTGFGVMALLVGIERGFISRNQGIDRLKKIVGFLESADRFHGAWPHWLNGSTGKTIPFSQKDDGGDLVETGLLMQGLLTAKAYLNPGTEEEGKLAQRIQDLWEGVEWNWYTRGGQSRLYWHWSPNHGWDINLPISGYNEALIVYILAAASPTYPISQEVYQEGWRRNGQILNGESYFQIPLPLGKAYGGPLFFAHYSFLGLDPRHLREGEISYWEQARNHTRIHQAYSIANPKGFPGYSEECWGLTASDSPGGYAAHSPTRDLGVISPTAALSSFPYTPEASMKALNFFYYEMGDQLWGAHGFYDAFSIEEQWVANSYLAIDQGPILLMIENHRSGLLWELFMSNEAVKTGLDNLNFTY